MKAFFIFTLLSITFFNSTAQYIPTVVEGNQWTIHRNMGLRQTIEYDYFLKDSIRVQDHTYLKIYNYSNKILGYVRENIEEQTVYSLDINSGQESLIINYNLEVGDSMVIEGFEYVCDSVKTEFLFGKNRKVVYLLPTLQLIEGVGHSFRGVRPTGGYGTITRFCENGEDCIPLPGSGITSSDNPILIYPNPASNLLLITKVSAYQLFDATGVLLFEGNDSEVNVQMLNPGFYFIKIHEEIFRFLKY